jgi:hypothetical protein
VSKLDAGAMELCKAYIISQYFGKEDSATVLAGLQDSIESLKTTITTMDKSLNTVINTMDQKLDDVVDKRMNIMTAMQKLMSRSRSWVEIR